MENKESFSFTYSAKEQDEIKKIREKYESKAAVAEDALTRLRRLDASVTSKATTLSLILGIVGALVMGFGMSLIMTDLAESLGIANPMLLGIIIGLVGMIPVILAYPVYNATVRKERKKIAPEIIRLTEELIK